MFCLITAMLSPVAPATAAAPPGGREFRQGYKDGFAYGMEAARTDCKKPIREPSYKVDDYIRGYMVGLDRGFDAGYKLYC
ncbi:hypothetical protein GCM10010112_81330 [Actinoplanes lobatus]|uniref:Uncharacterized protein n=1 Tax=Actinoplanes lobatus TaxID=113568 RepID=A0ABQ4ADL5_9ACTN|nr:hypothetical protein GCM10010112_81330 [Actinoplanes lobatus]GIE38564.1 hypothetical protein Alo02nite_14620 [Actinoplanes lobatus]